MSYDLHITRRKIWSVPGPDITVEEWHAAVEADPSLSWCKERGPHVALWSGPRSRTEPCLEWFYGNIDAKSPDAPFIDKIVALAQILGARVQGDHCEPYGFCDAPLEEPPRTFGARLKAWFAELRGG